MEEKVNYQGIVEKKDWFFENGQVVYLDDLKPEEIQVRRLRSLAKGENMLRLTSFYPETNKTCDLCGRQVIVSKKWQNTDQAVFKVKVNDEESICDFKLEFEKRVCVDCAFSAILQSLKGVR